MILPDDVNASLDETLEKINQEYPEHSRTSCNDENLYNCSTIFLHSRCSRCDALEKLRLWRIEYEYKELKAQLASA